MLITTQPTISGKGVISANTLHYPVKRILRRKVELFNDDLWLTVLECEKKKLIEVKFLMTWVKDSINEKLIHSEVTDGLFSKLYRLSIAKEMETWSRTQIDMNNEWNVVRGEAIRHFLNQLLYNQLETEMREELKERAGINKNSPLRISALSLPENFFD